MLIETSQLVRLQGPSGMPRSDAPRTVVHGPQIPLTQSVIPLLDDRPLEYTIIDPGSDFTSNVDLIGYSGPIAENSN